MVVIGQKRPVIQPNAVDLHQMAQGPGIFGHQNIGQAQHIQRAQRNIARRPDRGRNEMQPGNQRFGAVGLIKRGGLCWRPPAEILPAHPPAAFSKVYLRMLSA